MQSVPITTKIVSFDPTYDEVHSIQLYVTKFVSPLPWYSWNIVESGVKHMYTNILWVKYIYLLSKFTVSNHAKNQKFKDSNIYQLLPTKNHEHPMVRQSQKRGYLAKSKPGPQKHTN